MSPKSLRQVRSRGRRPRLRRRHLLQGAEAEGAVRPKVGRADRTSRPKAEASARRSGRIAVQTVGLIVGRIVVQTVGQIGEQIGVVIVRSVSTIEVPTAALIGEARIAAGRNGAGLTGAGRIGEIGIPVAEVGVVVVVVVVGKAAGACRPNRAAAVVDRAEDRRAVRWGIRRAAGIRWATVDSVASARSARAAGCPGT